MTSINSVNKAGIGFSQLPDDVIFRYNSIYGAHHYSRHKLIVRKAEGIWLYSLDNKKYLDCLAAYSAANQGHCHPKIVQALVEAMQGGHASVVSNVVYTDSSGLFLKKLAELAPQLGLCFGENGNKVLCKNGGVESVETAIKAARYYGYQAKGIPDGKQEIISFSTSESYRKGFGPLTPGYVSVAYGDLDAVQKAVNPNTCGILVEPMQGEGGMNVPPDGFLKGLREIADRYDLLLLFDEIQVALGRTGKMFCFEHENVIPDGIILGKAISGGLVPLSAFVTNAKIMDMVFQPGREGSTYGGYPLAMAAGNAAIDVIIDEKLPENSVRVGTYLKKKIEDIAARSPHVKEVRGRGLFIGIEVKNGDAMSFCRKMLEFGLLANDSHGHTIRISPPLIVTEHDADYIAERLEKVLVE
jgi:ornithine--oxo-acid transaminase